MNIENETDMTTVPLTKEQIEVMTILRVPLFHRYETGNRYIAKRYWYSIKPALQEALTRVLNGCEADHE